MITSFLLLGSILLIGGFLGILISDSSYIVFIIGGSICIIMCTLIESNPTKQDVLDGKAIYQETQIITGNDTIKTYDIIWKQKN